MTEQGKTCRDCGVVKPADQFRLRHDRPGHRMTACQDCVKADRRRRTLRDTAARQAGEAKARDFDRIPPTPRAEIRRRWPRMLQPVPDEVFAKGRFVPPDAPFNCERGGSPSNTGVMETCASLDEWRRKAGHLIGPAMGGRR